MSKRKYKTADEIFGKGWSTPSGMAETHAAIAYYHARDFLKAVKRYKKDPKNFHNTWDFLYDHPANDDPVDPNNSRWLENYHIMVVKVDPKTKRIEQRKNKKGYDRPDKKRNTETNIWIEWGPQGSPAEAALWAWPNATPEDFPQGQSTHDTRVDTGGKTFEEAVINLAHNIYMLYGSEKNPPKGAKLKKKDRW